MQTATATWDNLPQILVGALWLNACLAPALVLAFLGLGMPAAIAGVLLAAPGWVALQRYQMGLVEGRAVPLATLLKAFRHFWTRGVRLGVLGLFLPVVTWLAGGWLTPSGLAVPVLTVGLLASFLVGSVLVLYAVPLLVAYDQDAAGGAAQQRDLTGTAYQRHGGHGGPGRAVHFGNHLREFGVDVRAAGAVRHVCGQQLPACHRTRGSGMTKLILVGGFLGAGKTTLLLAAGKELRARGLRVGLVTNDQGDQLVDTALATQARLPVVEVAGGCFCCRLPDLLSSLDTLQRTVAAGRDPGRARGELHGYHGDGDAPIGGAAGPEL